MQNTDIDVPNKNTNNSASIQPTFNDTAYVTNIEQDTLANEFYRDVVFTSVNQQLVLMSIKPGDDIDFEVHPDNDQFIRIEKGQGKLLIGPKKESSYDLTDGTSAQFQLELGIK